MIKRRGFNVAWNLDAGSRINGGLAIIGDTLIFDTFNMEVVAVRARTGEQIWRSRAHNVLMSTPVVADDMVYVGSGHNGRLVPPADNRFTYTPNDPGNPIWGHPAGDAVIAYDLATGKERWTYKTVGEDMPSPALVDGVLIFANGDLHAYGLAGASGKQLWKHQLDGLATMASATVAQGRVFLSACNDAPYRCHTIAVEPRSGSMLWSSPNGNSDSSPTFADGRVFVSGIENVDGPYSQGGRTVVAALDARSGKVLWRYRTPGTGPYTEVGSNERAIAGTYAQGTYYQAVPSQDLLLAFDGASGRIRWTFKSLGPIKMSPVIDSGRLYVGDGAGVLYVLDSRTGTLFTSRTFKRGFTVSPPLLVGDTMFVANDSFVYAIPIH
ncbi:MAG: PQQ-binding-like beta-propeller repeat protein [Candidatus Eremiobacteraeota bacterium]|nr:PQQ-binding-like beta-propeller repeat protein [Candidatus Eremiobacteraeota bacterium]